MFRDVTTHTDYGTPYASPFATIGSFVLAEPGQLAEVAFITTEVVASGQQPQVGLLCDEIAGDFEALVDYVPDPPELAPSTSVISNRFYLDQGENPIVMRHMQVQLTFPENAVRNELLSLTIDGAVASE